MIITTTKKLRERDDFDDYPTPIELCRAALAECPLASTQPKARLYIMDPGAGRGNWGTAAREIWPNSVIYGIEVRTLNQPPAYDYWLTGDYIFRPSLYKLDRFDMVIGNPPYGDLWDQRQRKLAKQAKQENKKYQRPPRPIKQPVADAEAFVRKALSELTHGGWVVFLLRLAFLEGQDRYRRLWRYAIPSNVLTLSRRPSFTGDGNTDATAYATYYWQKGYEPDRYAGGWLNW